MPGHNAKYDRSMSITTPKQQKQIIAKLLKIPINPPECKHFRKTCLNY